MTRTDRDGPKMNIRDGSYELMPFGEGHVAEAVMIEKECFSEPCGEAALKYLYTSPNAYAVACVNTGDGCLAAYGGAEYVIDEAEILNVATRRDMRRRGCAEAVMRKLEKELSARGVRRVFLDVRESNEAAKSLYRKLGYTDEGIRRHFYRFPAEDAVIMSKIIG
ncbi:MAG: ribosomal protein S18-alanine N-acetyltransferase [Clostridia bacterium]|nr:ribosomal protein S18-alanine N-acetyltransferase [Clostridia bacterium]